MGTRLSPDLLVLYKKETRSNLCLLHKVKPMFSHIGELIFNKNALAKPTQNIFYHTLYYLVYFIDVNVHGSLTWPLCDKTREQQYKRELCSFITDYSINGLLTPVKSSFLVNPGCVKVTVLLFELSQLAINRVVENKIDFSMKELYYNITDKYKTTPPKSFIELIHSLKYEEALLAKLSNYLQKKDQMEQIAELMRKKITSCETTLVSINPQGYIDKLIDKFLAKYELDELSKSELLNIKIISVPSTIFDHCLMEIDEKLDILETNWNKKTLAVMHKSKNMQQLTEDIIQRHIGQVERSTYTVEYNPKTDEIPIDDLLKQVNSEQKFILRNLHNNGRLNFPNLVRAFLISQSFILKNNEIGDDIYTSNQYFSNGERNYNEILSTLKELLERLNNAEVKLQHSPVSTYSELESIEPCFGLPPKLNDLKMNQHYKYGIIDAMTPMDLSKYQFNLRGRIPFVKSQPKTIFSSFHRVPKSDFLNTLRPLHTDLFDHKNINHTSHDISTISCIQANETIAGCSSGFTKQQVMRLLSTKKSSNSKKYSKKQQRPDSKIIKGDLFNESIVANDSNVLFRSYSSPNLLENRERKEMIRKPIRKLSIMQEDNPSQHDVSGITSLDFKFLDGANAESSRKESCCNKTSDNTTFKCVPELKIAISPILETSPKINSPINKIQIETPKASEALIKRTGSLEKILKRLKKVRASVLLPKDEPIVEDKEMNANTTAFSVNRNLLPDLLSPSYSKLSKGNKNMESVDSMFLEMPKVEYRRPRESLGTALGVDHTFLDQFDLID